MTHHHCGHCGQGLPSASGVRRHLAHSIECQAAVLLHGQEDVDVDGPEDMLNPMEDPWIDGHANDDHSPVVPHEDSNTTLDNGVLIDDGASNTSAGHDDDDQQYFPRYAKVFQE